MASALATGQGSEVGAALLSVGHRKIPPCGVAFLLKGALTQQRIGVCDSKSSAHSITPVAPQLSGVVGNKNSNQEN